MKEVDGDRKVVRAKRDRGSLTCWSRFRRTAHGVIEKSGLGQRGWIPTDRHRLNMEGRENVFVLGDTTNLPISKAGSTAHFEAEAPGHGQARAPVRDYDGKVFCFIEAGKDRATYAMFDYENPPSPSCRRAPCTGSRWRATTSCTGPRRAVCSEGGRHERTHQRIGRHGRRTGTRRRRCTRLADRRQVAPGRRAPTRST
ncbi:MAG: hypothetical protein R3E48_08145 [Burkholderiaceae bacterium]